MPIADGGENFDILDTIRAEGEISDGTEEKLKALMDDFAKSYA